MKNCAKNDCKVSKFSLLILLIGCALGVIACQSEKKQSPPPLSPEKMIQVLIDIHIAESQVPNLVSTPDSSYFLNKAFERKVFQKHKIDSAAYYQSYAYYLENIAEFEKMYAIVVDSLVYRESTHNLGKPLDTAQKKNTSQPTPTKPRIDSSGLELKKKLRKKLLQNRINEL
ncbi:hypothetical protein Rain11_0825 [Raineya orbicola]|jgi:hypothetical protein|uniref:DUF4296 domain-containing protein n=1 Tax=Raineya orbicola TaxID=2016530 RepID=A0A2N3IIL2_9BACT|nr:hypothetical protein Rain11_0825 [Raineya orbicola]